MEKVTFYQKIRNLLKSKSNKKYVHQISNLAYGKMKNSAWGSIGSLHNHNKQIGTNRIE